MLFAMIPTPDRIIVSPIPEQVVVRCCIHPGERLPFSEGFVMQWEGYSLTNWKWEIAVIRDFDGRMKRELEGIILGELPRRPETRPVVKSAQAAPTGVYCPRYSRICPEGIEEFFRGKVMTGLQASAEMLQPKKKRGRPRKVVA